MRYHIDTIPVWDAVKLDGECPLCALRRRNELIDVDRFLGASVMEPDTRIQVNDKGFCARHQVLLYAQKNRLGHALMMHTHLKETMKKLTPLMDAAQAAAGKSGSTPALKRWVRGKGEGAEDLKDAAEKIRRLSASCILCDTIEEHTQRYTYTLLHLYKTDPAFRKAFAASKGVCLPDMAMLLSMAEEALSGEDLKDFVKDLRAAMERSLTKMEKDLEGFTLKFDYRNADKPWGDSRGSLERTANKLQGWCLGEEPNPK